MADRDRGFAQLSGEGSRLLGFAATFACLWAIGCAVVFTAGGPTYNYFMLVPRTLVVAVAIYVLWRRSLLMRLVPLLLLGAELMFLTGRYLVTFVPHWRLTYSLLFMLAFAPLMMGVAGFARQMLPRGRELIWMDAIIVWFAATLVTAEWLLLPSLTSTLTSGKPWLVITQQLVVWAFQALSMLALGMGLRSLFVCGSRDSGVAWLVIGCLTQYIGEMVTVGFVSTALLPRRVITDGLYLMSCIAVVIAAANPPPAQVKAPTEAARLRSIHREAYWMVACLLTPGAVQLTINFLGPGTGGWWTTVATVALSALVGVRLVRLIAQSHAESATLLERATRDPLTGVANRAAWTAASEYAEQTEHSDGSPYSVILLDLDKFKQYNDTHGHLAGDELLRAAAQHWLRHVPQRALVARLGGEEFAVLVPRCDITCAVELGNRLIANLPGGVTCSAGVAASSRGVGVQAVIGAADIALYRAKHSGRARVFAASHHDMARCVERSWDTLLPSMPVTVDIPVQQQR